MGRRTRPEKGGEETESKPGFLSPPGPPPPPPGIGKNIKKGRHGAGKIKNKEFFVQRVALRSSWFLDCSRSCTISEFAILQDVRELMLQSG